MVKPLHKYTFLPRTVNEMNQFIALLSSSLLSMKQSFHTVDIENIPKNSTLPTPEQMEQIITDLKKFSTCYENLAQLKKTTKQSKISEWIFISPQLEPIFLSCPIPVLKKENRVWMKKSDFFSVWSYWFRKQNMLQKGILSNLPKELEQVLGKQTLSWYEFQKFMYNMTETDTNVSQEWEEKWKKWKKTLNDANEEIKKKPKKQKVKKVKPTKKMVPSKSKLLQ